MKAIYYLAITSCLSTSVIHSMNLLKATEQNPNPQLISLLFNKMNPSHVLKNSKTFGQERDEQFDILTKMVSPKVITFIQNNPQNNTAQAMNRALNLVASRMAYFIGENAPILNQDPLSQNPEGNPVMALFGHSARASRDTIALLMPTDYFISNKEFLEKTLADKAEISFKAFSRSIEQLGTGPDEIVYIQEGRVISEEQAKQMTAGTDILGVFAAKEEFFRHFKDKIKGTNATEIIDEEADFSYCCAP